MKINVLDPKVYNRISAGEVVERPASIVKELIENSIDAGATQIKIEITDGGIKNITISDNGCGIDKDDIITAFLPHATSKIKEIDDLETLTSLGFRGEALASISSVCQVKFSTKTKDSEIGYMLKVNGGEFEKVIEVARENGTTLSCDNLFYNTPVRAKFLRKPKTEEGEVTLIVEKFMLSHSDISFQYYVDGKEIYNTNSCSMQDIIYTIYGKEVYDNLVAIDYEEDGYKVSGFVTKPKISKTNRTYQTLFVNGRFIENYFISNAVQSVFESFLMKGRFPVYILSLTLPIDCVDVNVHPSKREVKFDNPSKIYGIVRRAIENALMQTSQIQSFLSGTEEKEEAKFDTIPFEPIKNHLAENEGKSFNESTYFSDEIIENEIVVESEKKPENLMAEFNKISLRRNTDFGEKQATFGQTNSVSTKPKESEISFLKSSVRDEMKILGTIFKTYIVIELDQSIYFIDQHAAHERLLYDKLVKSIDENNVAKQDLLIPYSFTLGIKESQIMEEILPSLERIGFEVEKAGNTYEIKALPLLLSSIDLEKFVDEVVKESGSLERKASDYIHSKLCQSACKHAIKAGDTIDKEECAYIIEEVRKGVMLCPHGRPITLVITKYEFEKMFKRVL